MNGDTLQQSALEVNQSERKTEAEPPYVVSGITEHENLILDCAAQVSVIQPQAVPAECYTGQRRRVMGVPYS